MEKNKLVSWSSVILSLNAVKQGMLSRSQHSFFYPKIEHCLRKIYHILVKSIIFTFKELLYWTAEGFMLFTPCAFLVEYLHSPT